MEAVIATGAPKPAMPSSNAPKLNAIKRACSRRSSVSRVRERLMTSKSPLATVRLWKKTALRTIQLIGQRPNAMPSVAVPNVTPKGMPHTSQARMKAVSIEEIAQIQAGRRRTASMMKST